MKSDRRCVSSSAVKVGKGLISKRVDTLENVIKIPPPQGISLYQLQLMHSVLGKALALSQLQNPAREVEAGPSGALPLTFSSCKLRSDSPASTLRAACERECAHSQPSVCRGWSASQSHSWTSPVTFAVREVLQLTVHQVLLQGGGTLGIQSPKR